MKKILGVLVVALTMISSTFAFGLSIGGRGLLGGRLDLLKSSVETVEGGDFEHAIDRLSYGGGAYVYADLFGGLGAQVEASVVTNKLGINYLDVPLMGMLTLNFFDVVSVGVGGGLNLSKVISSDIKNELINAGKDAKNIMSWTKGIALAADVKIFFAKHLGLVIGARGVIEGEPNKLFQDAGSGIVGGAISGQGAGAAAGNAIGDILASNERREFYANVGLEFRLF